VKYKANQRTKQQNQKKKTKTNDKKERERKNLPSSPTPNFVSFSPSFFLSSFPNGFL